MEKHHNNNQKTEYKEIKQDRKMHKGFIYDVQSVYMLCMSNTQIFYYYQL